MYRSTRRAQPSSGLGGASGSAWAGDAAQQQQQQPHGYWAPPPQQYGDGREGGSTAYSLSSGQRGASPTGGVDVQAKRKIRRARRQERNAAMRYEELVTRLEQLIHDSGGAKLVTTDAIVQLYQVRCTAWRDAVCWVSACLPACPPPRPPPPVLARAAAPTASGD
eukprot:COSAG02_NODE_1601_length_11741_cov_40.329411_13_plen_165_part_00